MVLNIYFIDIFILFIVLLNFCIWGVKSVFLNGVCKWILRGYVGFLYKYNGLLLV